VHTWVIAEREVLQQLKLIVQDNIGDPSEPWTTGIAIPYGIYDLANRGSVVVGALRATCGAKSLQDDLLAGHRQRVGAEVVTVDRAGRQVPASIGVFEMADEVALLVLTLMS
jgi:hypothetical protein